jgi:hypothetical protein
MNGKNKYAWADKHLTGADVSISVFYNILPYSGLLFFYRSPSSSMAQTFPLSFQLPINYTSSA